MPRLKDAALSALQLLGLLDANNNPQFDWFADPAANIRNAIWVNRAQLDVILRALLDRDANKASDDFNPTGNLKWEPIKPSDGTDISVGVVWNDNDDDLRLGVGIKASMKVKVGEKGEEQTLAVEVLGRLVQLTKTTVSSELGSVDVAAQFPVPPFFMNSGSVTAGYEKPDKFSFTLTGQNKSGEDIAIAAPPVENLHWDAARLAAFIVHAWVRAKAVEALKDNPNDKGFFYRLDRHLFALAGKGNPPGAIKPLVPFDPSGQAPNFTPWTDSVMPTGPNGEKGALEFLWHLRALITGNESANVFSGSKYFSLMDIDGTGLAQNFPPSSFPTSRARLDDETGIWVGLRGKKDDSKIQELVLEAGTMPNPYVIVLCGFDTQNFQLIPPPALADPDFNVLNTALLAFGNGQITGELVTEGEYEITIFKQNVITETDPAKFAPLDGDYSFGFVLRDNQPIQYKFGTPILKASLPPTDPKAAAVEMVGQILRCLLNAALKPGHPLSKTVNGLVTIAENAIQGTPPTRQTILSLTASALSDALKAAGSPVSLGVDVNDERLPITPDVQIGPLKFDERGDTPVTIGKIGGSVTVDLKETSNPVAGFSIHLADLRFNPKPDGAAQLIAQLFPDLRDMEGLSARIDWTQSKGLTGGGAGKIPIQKTLGPIEIVALLIDLEIGNAGFLKIGVDLVFQLGPITVVAYELGVNVTFADRKVSFFLHGLGLSLDTSGIKLKGLFLELPKPSGESDYMGGAVVSVVNLFELAAIGGYSNIPVKKGSTEKKASLFIFASLVAPLGGPPWFFITGIAGGFGFNRNLPSPELMAQHPFLMVMNGELPFNGKDMAKIKESLEAIGQQFAPVDGQYWLAAGIQFTCFKVIHGKVVVTVGFGHEFSFGLLGILEYSIQPIVHFELAFMMTADKDKLLLKAGLTPNSYLLDPDIFSLRGDFGMGVFYGGPHAGDFFISIGGYHPLYDKPEHYSKLERVGCKALVFDFVHLNVEVFFAVTPQALMAGASVSLWAEFEGISAGLDVYVDVLMKYDPFYLVASMGVSVWFEFLGRHEIGVDLQIHTPPFGGVATIDLALVSFDIEFGDNHHNPPPLKIYEFLKGQLNLPATPTGLDGATVAAFNTANAAGLFRIDFTEGRATAAPPDDQQQEGLGTPVAVQSEFAFTVKTKLPLFEDGVKGDLGEALSMPGLLHMPLCGIVAGSPLENRLALKSDRINWLEKAGKTRLAQKFPAALFGKDAVSMSQADSARDAIAKIDTKNPTIALTEGMDIRCDAQPNPLEPVGLSADSREQSDAQETFPLPLLLPAGPSEPLLSLKPTGAVGVFKIGTSKSATLTLLRPSKTSRQVAADESRNRNKPDAHIDWAFSTVARTVVSMNQRTLTFSSSPKGVPIVVVPVSPVRRSELLAVNLSVLPARMPQKIRIRPEITIGRPGVRRSALNRRRLTPALGIVTAIFKASSITLSIGTAGYFSITSARPGAMHIVNTKGKGTIRAISLSSGEEVLDDRYIVAGFPVTAPPRTCAIVLLHEGSEPPVPPVSAAGAAAAGILENIGVEADTPLIPLGSRTFAGHGCVVHTGAEPEPAPEMLEAIEGETVLSQTSSCTFSFPHVQPNATLVIVVEDASDEAEDALDQVRWAAYQALLSDMITVVTPDRTAFVMTVASRGSWTLDVDLGSDFRLGAVVVSTASGRAMATRLRQSLDWELIDDSVQTTNTTDIQVNLEVNQL